MENNFNEVLNGYFTRYIVDKGYGIIETEDCKSYLFVNDKSDLTKKEKFSQHNFRNGDKVQFKIKKDIKHRISIYDVVYIKNSRRDKLIEVAKELNILKGYLKKIEEKYYLKHISTQLLFPGESLPQPCEWALAGLAAYK